MQHVAAAPRPQQERPRRAHRDDRHHRVVGGAAADGVPVPGHAVPAVAVQAQADGPERLVRVVRVQGAAGGVQGRVRQRPVLVVEGQQPRDVHHPLVHLPPFGVPWHVRDQVLEQRVRAAHPARPDVDPGAVVQCGAPDRGAHLGRSDLVGQVEQRRLEARGWSFSRFREPYPLTD